MRKLCDLPGDTAVPWSQEYNTQSSTQTYPKIRPTWRAERPPPVSRRRRPERLSVCTETRRVLRGQAGKNPTRIRCWGRGDTRDLLYAEDSPAEETADLVRRERPGLSLRHGPRLPEAASLSSCDVSVPGTFSHRWEHLRSSPETGSPPRALRELAEVLPLLWLPTSCSVPALLPWTGKSELASPGLTLRVSPGHPVRARGSRLGHAYSFPLGIEHN